MAEKTFFVKRGWLIAKDAFGNMLPFFLHVRDKDIVWQSEHDEFLNDVMKDKSVADITEVNPAQILSFTSNIWNIEVNTFRNACTMRACISFDQETFEMSDDRKMLYSNLSLPLTMLDNSKLHIQTSISTEFEEVASAVASTSAVIDGNTKMIHNLSLRVRNFIHEFPDLYYNMDDYEFSKIYIEISGEFYNN